MINKYMEEEAMIEIDGKTRLIGLMGNPVELSLIHI